LPKKAATALESYCKNNYNQKSIFFVNLNKAFAKIHQDFCDIKIDVVELQYEIINAIKKHKSEFRPVEAKLILNNNEAFYVNKLINTIEFELTPSGLGNFARRAIRPKTGKDSYSIGLRFQSASEIIIDRDLCTVEIKKIKPDKDCINFWDDFKSVYDAGHKILSVPLAQGVLTHIVGLEKKWNHYFQESRSQYPWEMIINGYAFKRNKVAEQFMSPPKGDWIFMHPSAVIEDVKNAQDGDNTKSTVLIEVLGYNWWDRNNWYQPSGFSVGYIYANRPDIPARVDGTEIKDWGLAGSIHMNNSFTFGVSRHGDHNGIFVSIDLWKYFQSKKTFYSEYRTKIGNL
jgi:hypothetical protein